MGQASRYSLIDKYWSLLPQGSVERLLEELETLLGYLREDELRDRIAALQGEREDGAQ